MKNFFSSPDKEKKKSTYVSEQKKRVKSLLNRCMILYFFFHSPLCQPLKLLNDLLILSIDLKVSLLMINSTGLWREEFFRVPERGR